MSERVVFFMLVCIFITGCAETSLTESDTISNSSATTIAGQSEEKNLEQILTSGTVVEVPAGSIDALQAAVDQAGEGGVVLLKEGIHHESNTVEINHTMTVVGESGAVLVSDTQPPTSTGIMKPALFVHNTSNVTIRDLNIKPKDEIGGVAIFIEDSPSTLIYRNEISRHQWGVIVQEGDRTLIKRNNIVASPAWQTGDIPFSQGILVINGDFVEIKSNDISSAFAGVFTSDRKGLMVDNKLHNNSIGALICTAAGPFPTPEGNFVSAEQSSTRWIFRRNYAHDNAFGYLVIDGAHENLLVNNRAENNSVYDIELAGETERFGFVAPTSRDNIVNAGKFDDLVIKDCGVDNQVNGGQLVDITSDECF